jgi:hypothetical protein
MKTHCNNTAALLAVVVALMLAAACATNQSALQQMSTQTADQAKLAKAAYYDALGVYKLTASTYLRYKPIIEREDPALDARVKKAVNDMKAVLDKWKALDPSALLDAIKGGGSEEMQALRRQIIFDLADYIEKGGD